ncbi:hypothetical protein SFRURICE_018331 [Spodoptera frugiperda]|nr:hypothetical protein SFRURICE_018331 [Spodoptera frugiperda]
MGACEGTNLLTSHPSRETLRAPGMVRRSPDTISVAMRMTSHCQRAIGPPQMGPYKARQV